MCCSKNANAAWERLLARFEEEDRQREEAERRAEEAAAKRQASEPQREPARA
jgi:hypothetical protein